MTENPVKKPRRRRILTVIAVLVGLCVLSAGAAAISNTTLPEPPEQTAQLDALTMTQVAEAFHLRETLGDEVWPGFGTMDIPLLVWNNDYAFLFGYDGEPPPGWEQMDGWEVEEDPVYRTASGDFQAFSEQVVGDVYAGSMSTQVAMNQALIDGFHEMFPPLIEDVFPYRILLQSTEVYISGLLHEAFHAYQQMAMGERLPNAEQAYADGDAYAALADEMRDGWKAEAGLLIDALKAESDDEARDVVRQWLGQRAARRDAAGLSEDLVLYEQRYEWLEGLAKYIELGIWEAAAESEDYRPLPALVDDPSFSDYGTFQSRWRSELLTMRNTVGGEGDGGFYYTGMAQARLLDRLLPGWKERAEQDGVWLEDLLAEAVSE